MNHSLDHSTAAPDRAQVLMGLLGVAHALEDRLESALAEVGLSTPRLGVLNLLLDGPLPLSELAAGLNCVRSNVTQLVDRLEADGLVRRVHDRSDRRSIRAEITPLGRERQAAGASRMAEAQQEFLDRLEGVDVDALRQALAALG